MSPNAGVFATYKVLPLLSPKVEKQISPGVCQASRDMNVALPRNALGVYTRGGRIHRKIHAP